MKIGAANSVRGKIDLPGDKSISHRAALLGAIAEGETVIENFAESEDCAATIRCLRLLGVEIIQDGSRLEIRGVGGNGFTRPEKSLDCGNSGTTMRLLAGILACQPFDSVLTGDHSLSARPMRRIIEPLTQMGAVIDADDCRAPLLIGRRDALLKAIRYEMPVASAQIKSCLLLAGMSADGKTSVRSPPAARQMPTSRDHTELMLRDMGAELEDVFVETSRGFVHEVSIEGGVVLAAGDRRIPGDISSAAFFAVAAACLEGSDIILRAVGLNPTRSAVLDVLKGFGARISISRQSTNGGEPIGDLRITGGGMVAPRAESNIISGEVIGNLIDELPVLAVFGTRLSGGLEIRDAGELRVKESDRIAATVENLRRMGARVEEFEDGLRVARTDLKGARVDSFGDHRIAMAFAVAGLLAVGGETEIIDAECAAVSFPDFFRVLSGMVK